MLKGLLVGLGVLIVGGYVVNEVKKQKEQEEKEFQKWCDDIVEVCKNAVPKPEEIVTKLSKKYN